MAEIRLENVSKSFGSAKIIEHLNLTIQDGSFTVLLGPSGCGKTTLLRMIAGIGPATSGKIYMDGEDISDVPPGKRNVAMVFQNYAIYPTMSVRENIEFCLKNNKVPKKVRTERVERVAETVGLKEYLGRRPSELSGGQRQRVALARAMVKEPAVFLIKLRDAMLLGRPFPVQMVLVRVENHHAVPDRPHQLRLTCPIPAHIGNQVGVFSHLDLVLLGGTEHRRRLAGNGILHPGVELPQRLKILLAQKEVNSSFGQNIKIGLRHDVFLLSNFNL